MMNRLALTSLALAGACSAQTDSGYEGDLLASLNGQVTSSRADTPPDAEAMAIWLPNDDRTVVLTGERVDIEGSFPSAFRLDITQPPSDDATRDGDGGVAIGYLTVVPSGTTEDELTGPDDPSSLLLGVEEDHMILWIGTEAAGTAFDDFYGTGVVTPGYHVVDVLGLTKEEDDQVDACLWGAEDDAASDACRAAQRDLYEQRYPGVSWDADIPLDKLRVSEDDLDAELAIDLKDSGAEMDFPDFD